MQLRLLHRVVDPKLGFVREKLEGLQAFDVAAAPSSVAHLRALEPEREPPVVEISHPWPEWIALMECLLSKSFLDRSAFASSSRSSPTMDSNLVRTACLNFARDRPGLIRHFSRRDIQVIVGYGCPSSDRKVVNSGKRLRAHVGIEEGEVCSSCILRGNCERAYIKAREDEGGRTVDVMRILLTHGLSLSTGSVENQACFKQNVKDSSRKLLNEIVDLSDKALNSDASKLSNGKLLSRLDKLSGHLMPNGQTSIPMKQGDWICPKCNFLNFAKNIKCLRCDGLFQERLRKLNEDSDHLPLKKGDWICEKCNFLNFAKNTNCLQCHEKPSNRNLNPGEWECPSCNYVNFRRNFLCLRCNWRRPKAQSSEENASGSQHISQEQHKYSTIKFVQNNKDSHQQLLQRNFPAQDEETGFWSSEQERNGTDEDNDKFSANKFFELDNFPIAGGNSAVSQNPHLRNKWKEEMSKRSRGNSPERTDQKDDDLDFASFSILDDLDESDDEDDIGGWFRYSK